MNIIFTRHSASRMKSRGVSEQDALDTLRYPDIIIKKYEKYYYRKKTMNGILEICCEKTENNIKIITLYWV